MGFSLDNRENLEYLRSLFTFPINLENVKKNSVIIKKLDIIRKAQQLTKKIYTELSDMNGSESLSDILSKIEGPLMMGATNTESKALSTKPSAPNGVNDLYIT